MAKKRNVARGEEPKMNMTPMIDMTFLLVVFFMLTIDLSTKEFVPVELPIASKGAENKERNPDNPRFVVNIEAGGKVSINGNPYEMGTDDLTLQQGAIEKLKSELLNFVQARKAKGEDVYEPEGACKIPVLIHADRAAAWRFVQWAMQAAADEKIKIYQMQFSVKRPAGQEED